MVYKTNVNKEKNNIENFKEQNFKGSRLIARSINNFFRSIRLKISKSKEQSIKPGFSGWGDFTHRKIEDTNKKLWEPFGFREGLRKNGLIIYAKKDSHIIEAIEMICPEHLELLNKDYKKYIHKFSHHLMRV